jgi:uncharacterized protein (TIGR04255 family)
MRAPVKFDRPPVVEVACGVLFAGQSPIKTVHIGEFWHRIKDEFPRFEDALPLMPMVEGTDVSLEDFGWSSLPPLRRAWLLNEDGSNLIQVQQDRFLFNSEQRILS